MQWQAVVCVTCVIVILLLGGRPFALARGDISCDFDDGDCDYTSTGDDTIAWKLNSNGEFSAGQHMFAGAFEPTTVLTSSVFNFSQSVCLKFRYRIHDDNGETTLSIYSVDGDTSSSSVKNEILRHEGLSSKWVKVSKAMSHSDPFRLQIEITGNREVDIDDVRVLPSGACFHFLSCDFDKGWCNYNTTSTNLSLSNSTLSAVTGPLSDNTGESGSFAAFPADLSTTETSARLVAPHPTDFSSMPWCLQFSYQAFGSDGQLQILGTSDASLWNGSSLQDRNWHFEQVELTTNEQITFQFRGADTIVALDDIYADIGPCQPRPSADCDFESDLCNYAVSGNSQEVEREDDKLENVALGKPVHLSPDWSNPELKGNIVDSVYGTNGSETCITSLSADSEPYHWVYIDLLDRYDVENVIVYTRNDCCVENFQDVSVHVSDAVTHDDLSQDDLCSETMGTPSLGEVITLPCSGGVKTGRYVWLKRGPDDPLSICDVDIMARTDYFLRRKVTPPENATAVLESPVLTGDPSKFCLSFLYSLEEEDTGSLRVYTQTMGGERTIVFEASNYTAGLTLVELDLDFTEPIKVVFEAVAYLNSTSNATAANAALDSVSVDWGTCQPVPFTSNWMFDCDRPTTPCARGADCEDGVCVCVDVGDDGQQCQIPAANSSCPSSDPPDCGGGQCYTKEDSEAGCNCDDGYYGQNCEHEMVHAECDDNMMVVNIYPYGYDVTKLASNQPLPPETEDGKCQFLTADVFEMANPLYIQKNWDGYVRAFLHTDPNCGNVSIVEDSDTQTIYSRTFHVYYNYLGRDPTDTEVTVNCTVHKEVTTTTTTPATTTTEMQTTTTTTPVPTTTTTPTTTPTTTTHPPTPPLPAPYVSGVVTLVGRRWLSRFPPAMEETLQLHLSLNVPNFAKMTAIRVVKCMVSTGSRSIVFVRNGCAVPPIGRLVMAGPTEWTQIMMIRLINRNPNRRLSFMCRVRLCHATTDFSCFKMSSCFGRKKRSVETLSDHAKGENEVNVTFDFSE